MQIHSRPVAVLVAAGLLVVTDRGIAQTVSARPAEWALASTSSASPASQEVPTSLPTNLIAPPGVRELAEEMWRRSPSFRRQIARLAATPGLQITIRQGMARRPGTSRAETTCHREGGQVARAEMWIPFGTDAVELLAHELEHIIEQLDDVDLPALLNQSGAGVRGASAAGPFETVRAIAVGRLVAKEMWSRATVMARR
jgi:hypothetical protein